jgi:hypothetical protein
MKQILFLLTILVTLSGCKQNKAPADWFAGHEDDAKRFAATYPVSEDNPFIFASFDELVMQFKYGTGVIVFGFPACPRCRNAFPVLEKAFKEMEMDRYAGLRGKILYYDMFDDREANNERYLTLVEYTKDFLRTDDSGRPRIYSPDVFFLAAGTILGNHLDTVPSLTNPRDSLNPEQEEELLKIYMDLIEKVEECGC